MLQLRIDETRDAFRAELGEWLEKNPAPEVDNYSSLEAFVVQGREWQSKLAAGRWVGVHWPSEYGGRSLSLVEEAIVQEELVRVHSPQLLGLFGLTMVGPVLIKHGTPEQKEKYLADILSAEKIWCQGFSEPGAGSDLAAIKTRGEVKEDGIYVTGQKVWTSFAQIADYCFLLCRTSDQGKKHEGLTYVLIDMKEQGITTRPLKQITGDDEFNEVFFDNVFVPKENIVGEIGSGWSIAISTLMYERVVLTFARQLQSEVALRNLVKEYGDSDDAVLLSELADQVAASCAVRALAYEHLMHYAAGNTPGPEGSLDKLFWTNSFQAIAKLGVSARGARAALGELDQQVEEELHRYLYSRGRSIAAGTSEIQRSIIAERVLGLPRIKFQKQ